MRLKTNLSQPSERVLGENGVEKIIELKRTDEELASLKKSADRVAESVKKLNIASG